MSMPCLQYSIRISKIGVYKLRNRDELKQISRNFRKYSVRRANRLLPSVLIGFFQSLSKFISNFFYFHSKVKNQHLLLKITTSKVFCGKAVPAVYVKSLLTIEIKDLIQFFTKILLLKNEKE